jgi:hypothetical protein
MQHVFVGVPAIVQGVPAQLMTPGVAPPSPNAIAPSLGNVETSAPESALPFEEPPRAALPPLAVLPSLVVLPPVPVLAPLPLLAPVFAAPDDIVESPPVPPLTEVEPSAARAPPVAMPDPWKPVSALLPQPAMDATTSKKVAEGANLRKQSLMTLSLCHAAICVDSGSNLGELVRIDERLAVPAPRIWSPTRSADRH